MANAARRLPAALLALVAVALPGCATLPSSGPVRKGNDLQLQRENPGVRPIGQPPVRGADPEDIVLGFLRAGADFGDGHAVARQYLAPAVRERWRPGAGASLYEPAEGDLSVAVPRPGQVTVSAPAVARIETDGQYVAAPRGARVDRTFRITKVDGEWRISALDDGLVLARSAVPQIYRKLNLYFVAPSRKVLVPDPVFLPALPGLSTKLVNRLLRGPTSALRGAVMTGFPAGTSLAVTSVPITPDGVATVQLEGQAGKASNAARELMSAQLVWTLKQLPKFQALSVTIDDQPLGVSGQDPLSREAWPAYDPSVVTDKVAAYAVRDGRVGQLVDRKFEPVAGPPGNGKLASRSVAVSVDLSRMAVVTADGRALFEGALSRRPWPTRRLVGEDLSRPSFDFLGNVWVSDRGTGVLWIVPAGAKPLPVALDGFKGGPITGVRVARDGARIAVVAGRGSDSRVYVGAVIRQPVTRVAAVREVRPELRSIGDVAWADATNLATMAHWEGAEGVPLMVDISGYEVTLIDPQPDLVSLAAAPPPNPLLGGTAARRLHQYTTRGQWEEIAEGIAPTYPG